MEKLFKEFRVPGVIWILGLMFLTLWLAWEVPRFAVYVPFVLAGISILINQFAPENSALRELANMIKSMLALQPPATRDVRLVDKPGPEGASRVIVPRLTEQDVDELVERAEPSKVGRILWG